jgi:hypothetical protein
MVAHSPRAFPWETKPPVGARQGTGNHQRQSRPRRPRLRICLRNGCTRKYSPRCYHQRYCQHPDCQRELNRWRSARRQAKRREDPNVKTQHAQAEKARRQRAKSLPQTVEKPELAPPRGHIARTFFFPGHCAIGLAATDNPPARPATKRATALAPAGRPCAPPWIGNASGGPAAPWTDGRSEPSSIKRPSAAAPFDTPPLPRHRRRGHPPSDRSSSCRAGRQLSRFGLCAGLLEQPLNP